jgi:hypothetical protein
MNDTAITRNDTVRLTCEVDNGREPFLYFWYPEERLDDPYASSPAANPDSSMMYYIVVTDLTGCVSEDSVFVDVVEEPSVACETGGHDSLYADPHYERYIPNPLFVSYTVTNTGTVALTGCEASIILPTEFALAGSDSTQVFTAPEYRNQLGGPVSPGTLLPNASCTRWWMIAPTSQIVDPGPVDITWQWTSDQQGTGAGCSSVIEAVPDSPESIVLSPLHLYFEAERGGALPDGQNIQLWPGSGLSMPWTMQPSEVWLDVNPLAGNQEATVAVKPNSTILEVGAHATGLQLSATPSNRSITVTYVIRKSTGIEYPAAPSALILEAWPQPVHVGGMLHVRVGEESGTRYRVTLHDMLGRERLSHPVASATTWSIDVASRNLTAGAYVIRISTENGELVSKMISIIR